MFSAYIKIKQLTDEVKNRHKIKLGAKIPRFDVTAVAGYCKPLESLKNAKGQIVFYLNETRGIINSSDQRRADRWLMGKSSYNFSSVFLLDNDNNTATLTGYGNPSAQKTFGKKQLPNPFLECKNDGFLFVITPDWSTIEVLIIPDGKFTILGNAKELSDGLYNEALQVMRNTSKSMFQY